MAGTDAPEMQVEDAVAVLLQPIGDLCGNVGSGLMSSSTAPAERNRLKAQIPTTAAPRRPTAGSSQSQLSALAANNPTITRTETTTSVATCTKAARRLLSRR